MAVGIVREYDALVVGAGPAGACAARRLALDGARVLMAERKPRVGMPVQCAEYVPMFITYYVPLEAGHIAQRVDEMETFLPTGEVVRNRFPGYVLHRSLFDKSLVASALKAGAELLLGARVTGLSDRGVVIESRGPGGRERFEVAAKVVIGADGPISTVGKAVGRENTEFVAGAQCEVLLDRPLEATRVYFDPEYFGGYGWVFPKGDTANVGVGVQLTGVPGPGNSLLEAREVLEGFLDKLKVGRGRVLGYTGGLIPVGGPLAATSGRVLLAGDAAGHTHPLTGAGILHAVIGGEAAGRAAARAIRDDDMEALQAYDDEWRSIFGRSLERAAERRALLLSNWCCDRAALSQLIRRTWIAFRSPADRPLMDVPRRSPQWGREAWR
ncbi:MAG TPA: NAD(P)/FAD-dependent oxidoreductase [Firmicutes bacterium]|nr:NAD(P)/FAD-dependent oxidoreductase [Bacillota bacterium]